MRLQVPFALFRWSYGVLLYEIFSAGEVPYEEILQDRLLSFLKAGRRLIQPVLCPDEM